MVALFELRQRAVAAYTELSARAGVCVDVVGEILVAPPGRLLDGSEEALATPPPFPSIQPRRLTAARLHRLLQSRPTGCELPRLLLWAPVAPEQQSRTVADREPTRLVIRDCRRDPGIAEDSCIDATAS